MGEFWEVLTRHFPEFRSGFFVTCRLVAISFVIAMGVGTLIAALRVAPVRWLNRVGAVYVETFRNIPLLVLIFIFYFGFPVAFNIGPWLAGTLALGLYTAAYIAETLRSGVFAVGKGQIDAALSLGLTYRETLQKIILPQSFRTVIPPLGNLIIAMIKNSAIIGASALAIPDLLKTGRIVAANTVKTHESFFWAASGYLILTVTATFIVRYLEKRLAIKR
ncbi:MAG TPA: amino acid ABC transporter permease [Actinomycetota bacterium]|nr:amino acid ABC transporter permease [Actinomycetota bacterium]